MNFYDNVHSFVARQLSEGRTSCAIAVERRAGGSCSELRWHDGVCDMRLSVTDTALLTLAHPFAPLGSNEWTVPISASGMIDWNVCAWPGLDSIAPAQRTQMEAALGRLMQVLPAPATVRPRMGAVIQSTLPW